jgi:hypothetical protein
VVFLALPRQAGKGLGLTNIVSSGEKNTHETIDF